MRTVASLLPAFLVVPPAVAVAAPLVPEQPAEHPDLIDIGNQIEPLLQRWRVAAAAKDEARALAERLRPQLRDEFVGRGPHRGRMCERERDVEGKDIWPEDVVLPDGRRYGRPPRMILDSKLMREQLADGSVYYPSRSPEGRRFRRLIDRVAKYEHGRRDAIRVSGLNEAIAERNVHVFELARLAVRATEIVPSTAAGVSIYARLLSALEEVGGPHGDNPRIAGAWLGQNLAKGVMTVLAGGVA